MAQVLTFARLRQAVSGRAAAFRSVTRLQPVGGQGDKIFPATYADGVYSSEKRRFPNADGTSREVDCILLNSVQSEANHAELALKQAYLDGQLRFPLIEVDFSATANFTKPIDNLTSLDVPHRLADAILRDSQLPDGVRFQHSSYAKSWERANLWNAGPIYELCPTALIFGMWGSPEKPGGLGAKFERAFVSEIIAVDCTRPEIRRGFRIDPLESANAAKIKPTKGGFELSNEKDALKPSELNHGNIVFDTANSGLRCEYAEQTTVVSLGALRKLRFPASGQQDAARDHAAQAVLAALALAAAVLAGERGTSLRSRCQLFPDESRTWQLLDTPGQNPETFTLTGTEAVALCNEAIAAAKAAGLSWLEDKLVLSPTPELLALVAKSQALKEAE